jgi:hypothetical protein
MIDTIHESPIPFRQIANELPRRRGGRKTHVATLYRWATAGCRGVVLESIQIGGTRCTSREALQRFFERLTHRNEPAIVTRENARLKATGRSIARRRRDSAEAGILLKQKGV